MRISEENDRRNREKLTLERLPRALDEVYAEIQECMKEYRRAFGDQSVESQKAAGRVRVTVRAEVNGRWQQAGRVDIDTDGTIPGFQVDRGTGAEPLTIEVGLLPGEKLYFRDRAKDQYINMDEVTRRILDRAFFPKLKGE